ncbi:hypothetical protein Efla_004500 [Eimeria flavescens]
MAAGLELAAFCAAESASMPLLPTRKEGEEQQHLQIAKAKRRDGRLLEEVRPMHIQTLSLGSASGSAFLSLGNTKVYCSVFGPRAVGRSDLQDRGHIKVDYRGSPFFSKNPNEGADTNERNAMLLHQALDSVVLLEKYPKSILDVCVMVLEDDGGALASALTCAGLALADAGVECYDILTGASAYAFTCQDESGGSRQIVCLDLDASEYEQFSELSDFTVVHVGFCPALASICCLQCRGPLIAGPSGEHHSFGVKEQQTIQDVSLKRSSPEGASPFLP